MILVKPVKDQEQKLTLTVSIAKKVLLVKLAMTFIIINNVSHSAQKEQYMIPLAMLVTPVKKRKNLTISLPVSILALADILMMSQYV
jgi:hypothetical protein